MPTAIIDLRSDTVSRPTPAMRAAMATAEVGDDVFDEDPTVHRLQRRIAEVLGKEAALFVPSGTMSNQIGVRLHCQRGDEVICEAECHIYNYEQGGAAQLSGVSVRPVAGEFGVLDVEQLQRAVRRDDVHYALTRLVCLENTHNRGGGRILPFENVAAICGWARAAGLAMHLDGARLFNAVVATGISAERWAAEFDTVSVCFSKGLGAPVGSALAGPKPLIERATRDRKVFGGGMRQAGIIAAGALYALEHHVERLAEDHAHARILAEAVRNSESLALRPAVVDTNLIVFDVDPRWGTAAELTKALAARGVLMIPFGPQRVRAVTHLDVGRADVERAARVLRAVAEASSLAAPPEVGG